MMAERERVICTECYTSFWRGDDEVWRVKCLSCWKRAQATRPPKVDQSEAFADLKAEIGSNIRGLIQLPHPDKHAGSELATRTTQWLNSLRQRLGL